MPLSSIVDLAAGGIAAGAAYGAAKFSAKEAKRAARINRDFQERLSNTAVQRRRADLEAAGFNPLLAITQGQGASQPGGATAVVPDYSRAVSTGVQAASANAQIRNTTANTALAQQKLWMNKPAEITGRVAAFAGGAALRLAKKANQKKPYPNWKGGKKRKRSVSVTKWPDFSTGSKANPNMFGGPKRERSSDYPHIRRQR